jgi:hypothetical protein
MKDYGIHLILSVWTACVMYAMYFEAFIFAISALHIVVGEIQFHRGKAATNVNLYSSRYIYIYKYISSFAWHLKVYLAGIYTWIIRFR